MSHLFDVRRVMPVLALVAAVAGFPAPVLAGWLDGGTDKAPAKAEDTAPEQVKVFGDWGVICDTSPDKTKKCFAQQVQKNKDDRLVLLTSIGYIGPDRAPAIVAVMPLGISIRAGAAYKVDDDPQVVMPIQMCTIEGCRAALTITEASLSSMVHGKAMVIGIVPWGQKATATIKVSLKGLGDALAASR